MTENKKVYTVLKSAVENNRKLKIDKEIYKKALESEQQYIQRINTEYLREKGEKEQAIKQMNDLKKEYSGDDKILEQFLIQLGGSLTDNEKKEIDDNYKKLLSDKIL